MKKTELLKIIREEVEVVLTDAEMIEMFDLDPSKLLDEMMGEDLKSIGKGRVTRAQHRLHRKQQGQEAGGGIGDDVNPREVDLIQGVETFLTDLAKDENLLKYRPRIVALLTQMKNSAQGGAEGEAGGAEGEADL